MQKFQTYCESILKQLSKSEEQIILNDARNEVPFSENETKMIQNFIVKPTLLKPEGLATYKNIKVSSGTFDINLTKVKKDNINCFEAVSQNKTKDELNKSFGATSQTFKSDEDTATLLMFLNRIFER